MSPLALKDDESAVWLVAEYLRTERYDEALVRLYEEAERRPDDRSVRQAITTVRERMADRVIAKLGDLAGVLQGTGERSSEPMGADERYLLTSVDGTRTIDEILRTSTLGRLRTARVLTWLVERKLVRVQVPLAKAAARPVELVRNGPIESVLVADANATQASLVRTMLRVSLGRTVVFRSVGSGDELLDLAGREKPDLVVLDYRLPGRGDGIATLRLMRAMAGLGAVPAIVLVQRIELDYAEAHLPALVAALPRPLDRESLQNALQRVVPGAVAR